MAGPLRIKGQESEIRLLRNGAPTQAINAILSFSMTDELEVLEESYLGETESRYDSIYKGTSASFEIHIEQTVSFDLRDEIVAKAQRRDAAAARFDIAYVLTAPNGQSRLFTMVDFQFGPIETNDSARAEYVTMSFEGSCSVVQSLNL
jgi:hypothetical protein